MHSVFLEFNILHKYFLKLPVKFGYLDVVHTNYIYNVYYRNLKYALSLKILN